MKRLSCAVLLLLAVTLQILSQRVDKPTLTPIQCTESQKATIAEGTVLHDGKKYDDAIAKYQDVLNENPDCMSALYELSMSYYYKGEKSKAMEVAYKGSKYKSEQLPLFYLTMANVLDDIGKGNEAVQVYIDGIKILEGNKDMRPHLSSLHYNLGLSYRRQKKDAEAREEMKLAIIANDRYASPHYQLADIFYFGKYKIPALFAAARFISLEYNTDRSKRAAALVYNVLGSTAAQKGADNKIVIGLDIGAPTDEGDFSLPFFGTPTVRPRTLSYMYGEGTLLSLGEGCKPGDVWATAPIRVPNRSGINAPALEGRLEVLRKEGFSDPVRPSAVFGAVEAPTLLDGTPVESLLVKGRALWEYVYSDPAIHPISLWGLFAPGGAAAAGRRRVRRQHDRQGGSLGGHGLRPGLARRLRALGERGWNGGERRCPRPRRRPRGQREDAARAPLGRRMLKVVSLTPGRVREILRVPPLADRCPSGLRSTVGSRV